jgi:two-component system OmpR family sensor kinase
MASAVPASPHSLRHRLLWLVLAAIGIVSLLQASTAYRTALREADKMFDYHLQEVARSVHAGVRMGPGESPDFVVRIWGPDGAEVYRSAGTQLPPQAILGFSDVAFRGTRYRVYSVQTGDQTVQIAQDLDARQQRARVLALNAALPVLLLAPLLMAAVWWLIDRSLKPVESMRRQVAGRAASDLSPLPQEGLPREVLPLVEELNLLFARVDAALRAQQHFVADAAHELRSPLTALKLQAQAVRRAADDDTRDAAAGRLNDGIERAIQLLGQLLVLAREEGGAEEGSTVAVELEGLAREVVSEVLPQAQARQLDLGLAEGEALQVRGQPDALRVLLRNLVDNAVKYTPAGGRIDLRLQRDNGFAVLRVDDSGPGIPAAERQRAFDRFYRVPGASEPGSGLGLAIVKAIADRHGAAVVLSDSPLGGLSVEVRFAP